MAIPNIFSPNTRIRSAEVNTDFTYTDYTAIDNNKKIQWDNAAGSLSSFITQKANDDIEFRIGEANKSFLVATSAGATAFAVAQNGTWVGTQLGYFLRAYETANVKYISASHNGTNALIQVSGGSLIISGAATSVDIVNELRMTGGSSAVIAAYNTGSTQRAYMQHDGSNGIFGSTLGKVAVIPAADGDVFQIHRLPRRSISSNTYVTSHIQSGWGYIVGNDTAVISATITFPVAYSSSNIRVIITPMGKNSSVPTAEGMAGNTTSTDPTSWDVFDVTSSNFLLTGTKASGGPLFNSTRYYMFSWIAIGPA